MPVDLWKEVFMKDNPEPHLVELFLKTSIAGPRETLEEASRRVRYEAKPDTVLVWRDPVPLIAIASIYYVEGGRLNIIVIEGNALIEELVVRIRDVLGASMVLPVKYPIGYGRERVQEAVNKVVKFARGASIRVADVTDTPGVFAAALHRAGVRHYTVVRRKGYEVLVEKIAI